MLLAESIGQGQIFINPPKVSRFKMKLSQAVKHPRLKRRGFKTIVTAEAISPYVGGTRYIF